MTELKRAIPLILPVLILHWTLVVVALTDLVKRKKVRFNSKILWALIIIFIQVIGPVIYFMGRGEEY